MAQQQRNEIIVPILVTQEEYNEIMKQPDYIQQQLLQQLQQKKQEQQQQLYQHPYLQYQNYPKQQENNNYSQIPPIPSRPVDNNNIQQQQQQYQYTPQQQLLQQYNQNLNQNLIEIQKVILQHKEVEAAGEREIIYFNSNLAKFFTLEIGISLIFNFVSALFRMKIINSYWQWSVGLWIVLTLYILLNLFILTNPKIVLQNNNQKFIYILHVVLFCLLMQGIQTAVQGYEYFIWNYYFYFYFMITSSFISLGLVIRSKGANLALQYYLPAIVLPVIFVCLLQLICTGRMYYPLLIWGVFVVLLTSSLILLFRRIIKIGYNKHQTSDYYAMASAMHILMFNPFYDNE